MSVHWTRSLAKWAEERAKRQSKMGTGTPIFPARQKRRQRSERPLGMRVMRRRASFISAPVAFSHSCRMASARGSTFRRQPAPQFTDLRGAYVESHGTGARDDLGSPPPAQGHSVLEPRREP